MAYCNGCGTVVPSSANFCQKCGSRVSDLEKKNQEEDSQSAKTIDAPKINYPQNGVAIECVSCSRMYRADLLKACPKCGNPTLGYSANKLNNFEFTSRIERESENSNSSNFKMIAGVLISLVIAVLVLSANSNRGISTYEDSDNSPVSTNEDSDNSQSGYWVSKCRTITERNPNYYDSDPSRVSDDLFGPPPFITRQECTDVWVDG